jgi:hypothetical protein
MIVIIHFNIYYYSQFIKYQVYSQLTIHNSQNERSIFNKSLSALNYCTTFMFYSDHQA